MLTKEAFNALLKTIEEPPAGVIFVLATTEEQKVLPTIVSRCQRLMFKLVSHGDLVNHLTKIAAQEKIHIEPAAVQFIARRSGGGLRDALGLLDQASLLSAPESPVKIQDLLLLVGALDEDIVLKIAQFILAGEGDKALSAVHELLHEGREPYLVAFELAKHFLAVAKASYITADVSESSVRSLISGSPEYIEKVIAQARNQDRSELSQIVELLDRLEQTCKRSSQPALNLEIGVLSLCHRLDLTELRALKERIVALEGNAYNDAPPPAHLVKPSSAKAQAPALMPTQPITPKPEEKAIDAPSQPVAPPTASLSVAEPKITDPAVLPQMPEIKEQVSAPPEEAPQTDETSSVASIEALQPEPAPSQIEAVETEEEKVAPTPPQTMTIFDEEEAPISRAAIAQQASPEEAKSVQDSDIDALWSDLLEDLQRRHIPSFSILSTHAFPLALTSNELTIGTLVETFQKMIESKIEHVKAAAEVAAGKSLFIKVKVASQDNNRKASKPASPRPKIDRERDQEASLKRAAEPAAPERAPERDGRPRENVAKSEPITNSSAAAQPVEGAAAKAALRQVASNIINEAYKLFEGPGSRLITSN
jgi:DNA polymerase III gamma/tau subunit